MANVYLLCKYCYFLLVVIYFCCVPVCQPRKYPGGKMRRKDQRTNSKGIRLIKAFHKKYSRKVQKAKSLEDFVQVFEKSDDITATLDRLLDASFKDRLASKQLTKGPSSLMNPQNLTHDARRQIELQIQLQDCSSPRPVLLDTHEVIGYEKGYLQYIYPKCIQVNRCGEHSGCCNLETETCSAKEGHIQNVTRQILFANVYLGGSKSKESELQVYTVEVEEHTLCECQEIHSRNRCYDLTCDSPKTKDMINCYCMCPQRCAIPYRSTDTCECECGDEQTQAGRNCRRMYRGKQTLSREECDCVKTGQCSKPSCRAKYVFDNTTCHCVRIQSKERISHNKNDSFDLFEASLDIRSMHNVPREERLPSVGVDLIPAVRSSHQVQVLLKSSPKVIPDTAKKDTIPNPMQSSISPDTSDYRHSSHTRYNGTQHNINEKHNASSSSSTKAKITVWDQAADDLNATNIKDRYSVDMKPNGTDQETISSGQRTANEDVITNSLPEKHQTPPLLFDDDVFDYENMTGSVGTSDDELSASSELEYSSSSYEEIIKSVDDLFSDPTNPEFDIYDGSGDNEFGGF